MITSYYKYILTDKILVSLCLFSLALLQIRFTYTGSFKFLFLVWNLFLAIIPFLLGRWLRFRESENSITTPALLLIWILFLPNAIYLITDFKHLNLSHVGLTVLDICILGTFSCAGIYMAFESMKDTFYVISRKIPAMIDNLYYGTITFLSAVGVYLGRVLRWNSWDVLRDPIGLTKDLVHIVLHPIEEIFAWTFIGCFFLCSLVAFNIYNRLFYDNEIL